jgi:hypothetical protein
MRACSAGSMVASRISAKASSASLGIGKRRRGVCLRGVEGGTGSDGRIREGVVNAHTGSWSLVCGNIVQGTGPDFSGVRGGAGRPMSGVFVSQWSILEGEVWLEGWWL